MLSDGYFRKILIVIIILLNFLSLKIVEVKILPTKPSLFEKGCTIKFNETFPKPQPLLLEPGTTKFISPSKWRQIKFNFTQTIELVCTKSFKGPLAGYKKILATCLYGYDFLVNDTIYGFNEFVCESEAQHIARRTGKKCYRRKGTEIEVGIDIEDRFIRLYEICHDEKTESTYYTHHKLNANNIRFQRHTTRPRFIEGDFYNGKSVNALYTKFKQKETIGGILGGNHTHYFNDSAALYLARGHLVAKADMIYASQQRATFYFINAAPQWQRFNAVNWQRVETGVRYFVARENIEIDCYTGTYGIMELPDINGNKQKIYLYIDENNNRKIPVPKFYFKILYHAESKRGIAFVGVNNPHLTYEEIAEDYILCDDISHLVTWVWWRKNDIIRGYSYACDLNEFTKVVNYLPKFKVTGILY